MDLLETASALLAVSQRLATAGAQRTATASLVTDVRQQMVDASVVLLAQKHGQHAAAAVTRAADLLDTSSTRISEAIRAINDGASFLQARATYRGPTG